MQKLDPSPDIDDFSCGKISGQQRGEENPEQGQGWDFFGNLAQPSQDPLPGKPEKKIEENLQLIKNIHAKDATEQEFNLFLYMAKTYQLDPLLRKIWLVKYGSAPAQIFTSRDGFLSIAHRSGQFNGMQTTLSEDGQSATCHVYRKDMEHPFSVTVYLRE